MSDRPAMVESLLHAWNMPWDRHVLLRIVWSTFWRSALIGALFSFLFKLLPEGEVAEALRHAAEQGGGYPAITMRAAAVLEQVNYFSAAYIYFLVKSYLPIFFANILALRIVFKKSYRRFALQPVDLQGVKKKQRLMEVVQQGLVYQLPLVVLAVLNYALPLIGGKALSFNTSFLLVSFIVGTVVMAVGAQLALHWPYRQFRIAILRKEGAV